MAISLLLDIGFIHLSFIMVFRKVLLLGLCLFGQLAYSVKLELKLAESARHAYYIQVYGQKLVTKRYYTDLTDYLEGYCLDHEQSFLCLELSPEERIEISNKKPGVHYDELQKFELFGGSKVLVGALLEHKRAHFGELVVSVIE